MRIQFNLAATHFNQMIKKWVQIWCEEVSGRKYSKLAQSFIAASYSLTAQVIWEWSCVIYGLHFCRTHLCFNSDTCMSLAVHGRFVKGAGLALGQFKQKVSTFKSRWKKDLLWYYKKEKVKSLRHKSKCREKAEVKRTVGSEGSSRFSAGCYCKGFPQIKTGADLLRPQSLLLNCCHPSTACLPPRPLQGKTNLLECYGWLTQGITVRPEISGWLLPSPDPHSPWP